MKTLLTVRLTATEFYTVDLHIEQFSSRNAAINFWLTNWLVLIGFDVSKPETIEKIGNFEYSDYMEFRQEVYAVKLPC